METESLNKKAEKEKKSTSGIKSQKTSAGLSPDENKTFQKLLKFFIGVLVAALIFRLLPTDSIELPVHKKVKIGGNEIKAEIVISEAKLAKGLSGRKSMPKDSGMLFVFADTGLHPFWMKDMLFPLDIIFVDQEFSIVDLRKNLQPCTDVVCDKIVPAGNIKYAIELNSGWLDEKNIKVGGKIEIVK